MLLQDSTDKAGKTAESVSLYNYQRGSRGQTSSSST